MNDNLQERRKHIVSFQCEPSTTQLLAELARDGERSLSGEIRLALREHLERSTEDPGVVPVPPLGRPEPIERRGSNSVARPAAARGENAA
jgi:hypothetical protein